YNKRSRFKRSRFSPEARISNSVNTADLSSGEIRQAGSAFPGKTDWPRGCTTNPVANVATAPRRVVVDIHPPNAEQNLSHGVAPQCPEDRACAAPWPMRGLWEGVRV